MFLVPVPFCGCVQPSGPGSCCCVPKGTKCPAACASGGSVPGLPGTLVWCSPPGPALGWGLPSAEAQLPLPAAAGCPHRVLDTEGWWRTLHLSVCLLPQVTAPSQCSKETPLSLRWVGSSLRHLCTAPAARASRWAWTGPGCTQQPRAQPLAVGLVRREQEDLEAGVCP